MADVKNSSGLFNREMENFKVRVYTNIPPNAVLVGHSRFTKNAKIYSKAFFHLPWFESRYISMETQNMDLAKQKYEINGEGLEIVADTAISYNVRPFKASDGKKYGIAQRWKSFVNSFKKSPIKQGLKSFLLASATVGSAFLIGPFCLAIPALSAGYVTFFHQDPEYIKNQGIYKTAYESSVAKQQLEQIIFEELRIYYANHNYEEIKGKTVNLDDPEFAHLKSELAEFSDKFGIDVTKINIKSADLTDKSNEILQRQREAKIEAERIKSEAVARKEALSEEAKGLEALIAVLKENGLNSQQIAAYLNSREYGHSGKTVFLKDADDPEKGKTIH